MAREYRDSGIEWIGQIPKEWNTISFTNSIVRMSTGLNPRDNFELTKDDEFFYVTIKNFKDGKIYLDDNCDRISKDAWDIIQERSQLQKGDILFASISKDGQAYILEDAPSNWNINESVFCIRVNPEYFYDRYFYYHITDSEYYNDLRLDATGTTFQSIKQNKLRKSVLCLPNKDEQQKIADYLDKVCSEVDEMVALQETMIEELKAYKQSVITEAVTRGLNPRSASPLGSSKNVPMRNSGIDWIGEIPEHWEIKRLKYVSSISRGLFNHRPRNDERYYGGIHPFIQTGDVARSNKYIDSYSQTLSDLGVSVSKFFPKGTLTMTIAANVGDVSILGFNAYFPDSVLGIIPFPDVDNIFLYYSLKAMKGEFVNAAIVSTQLNLNIERVYNMKTVIPPIAEQRAIVSYLDTKCSEIDSLIALKQAKIEELKEYKKSVIYEYVTGKKEVV